MKPFRNKGCGKCLSLCYNTAMKKLLFLVIFIAFSGIFTESYAQDTDREEALEEFDDGVNGARGTSDTVAPLTKRQLNDARCPMWDGPWCWDDPFFGPEDEMDYELWRVEHEDQY